MDPVIPPLCRKCGQPRERKHSCRPINANGRRGRARTLSLTPLGWAMSTYGRDPRITRKETIS